MLEADPEWLQFTPDKDWPYTDEQSRSFQRLHGMGKVNIFVGPNNGGKSRLLRRLARQQEFAFGVAQRQLKQLAEWLKAKDAETGPMWQMHGGLQNIGTLHRDSLSAVVVPEALLPANNSLASLRSLANSIRNATVATASGGTGHFMTPQSSFLQHLQVVAADLDARLDDIEQFDVSSLAPKHKVYIPVLRGLRRLGAANEDIFAQRITTEYFNNEQAAGAPRVFSGLSLYEDVKTQLLGPRDGRKLIRDYERFLAKHIFDVTDVALIPRLDFDVLSIKIGNEPERPVHDLGDGIQSVVILTYLLLNQEHTWFFIEEPELFLHPGLQRKILNLLLTSTAGHRAFLTTHSNHFLDMSLDYSGVAVYGVYKSHIAGRDDEREPRFRVEVLDAADQSALALLGVRNSSVFLVNATIWVEGVTDRFYLRALLDLYQTTLPPDAWHADEDVHFSFVEYGGGNVVHFAFGDRTDDDPRIAVNRLCSRAMVVADDDGGRKRQRLDDMKAVLNERLLVLPVREIENLLPWRVLRAVVAEYEGCDESRLVEPKSADLVNLPLGRLIEDNVLQGNPRRKGGYSEDSGTLKAKPDFCKRALAHMNDAGVLAELPANAEDLVRQIYEFIRNQNADAVDQHSP